MTVLGSYPEDGSKTSGNSSQIAYQQERSAIDADIKYILDNDMPSYFLQASFGICVG